MPCYPTGIRDLLLALLAENQHTRTSCPPPAAALAALAAAPRGEAAPRRAPPPPIALRVFRCLQGACRPAQPASPLRASARQFADRSAPQAFLGVGEQRGGSATE